MAAVATVAAITDRTGRSVGTGVQQEDESRSMSHKSTHTLCGE